MNVAIAKISVNGFLHATRSLSERQLEDPYLSDVIDEQRPVGRDGGDGVRAIGPVDIHNKLVSHPQAIPADINAVD